MKLVNGLTQTLRNLGPTRLVALAAVAFALIAFFTFIVTRLATPGMTLLYSGLDSGARGYALKAGSMEELVGAIHTIVAGGSYVDPRLDRILLSPRATAQVPQLSPREREIMHLMAEGGTAEAIGTALGVSVETVRTHVRNVIRKLQARNRVHAIALALERGEIALDEPPRAR